MKSIARVVHLPSVVQSEVYEATRILFVCKENKNNDLFSTIRLLSVSPRHRSTILDITHPTQAAHALLYRPWRCFSYFSEPRQCYLLGSRWDSHKPPGCDLKYLTLCSEDERSFYGVETTCG